MKLLYCPHCHDVRKLPMKEGGITAREEHECWCGKSWGYYTDGINAVYGGDAVMLGFNNSSLSATLDLQKRLGDRPDGFGYPFSAFIIPESAPSVKREGG